MSRLSPELAERLRDASLDALDRIVELALEHEVAFVILAGDLYDGLERGLRAQLRLRAAAERLGEAQIRTFVAHGNHDPKEGSWSAVSDWPKAISFFPSSRVASFDVLRDGEPLARVHGISYGQRHERDNLVLKFPHGEAHRYDVGVLHCAIEGESEHAAYSPCTVDDLLGRGMDYWALGHVHRQRIVHRDPWIVYAGNTQGRSFAAGEQGPKGAYLVHVEHGRTQRVAAVRTDQVRFLEVEQSIDGLDDLGALADALEQTALEAADDHPGVDLVLRGRLVGRGPTYDAVTNTAQREELLDALSDKSSDGVWWTDLEAHVAPPIDLAAVRDGGDLRAAILETSEAWIESPELLPDDVRQSLGRLGQVDPEVLTALMAEAARDVVSRLTEAD